MSRPKYDPATYPSPSERLKAVTDQLEAGVSEVFQSGKFENYLRTMAQFHHYSFNNVLLIAMQFPAASHVAGFNDWKRKFNRTVKRGEKGIKILAPCSYSMLVESEMIDPVTQQPLLDDKGKPIVKQTPIDARRFKVVTVFDVSQTEGEELPEIAAELTGSVDRYEEISGALKEMSPCPIKFANLPGGAKGCCDHAGNLITIQPGMSEAQTLKTMIHEITHAKLHAKPQGDGFFGDTSPEERQSREVEAESVAYVVCQHLGIDTSDYSFGYIAGWSQGKELAELKSSLKLIRDTAAELIAGIEGPDLDRQRPKHPKEVPRRQPPKRKQRQNVR